MSRLWVLITAALVVRAEGVLADKVQEIERLVSAEMSRQTIPGLSIAIGAGAEVLWTAGFGMSDIENNVPVKALTQYRTGSIAKPITAVAVMQLAEAGKIDLDAPVQRYVPSFPQKQWTITIRQLLSHLGGIRHYNTPDETNVTRHYRDLLPALRMFQSDPLVAEPGTQYSYSTYGYVLLGAALEQVASQRYMEYVRQKILRPTGMDRTRDDHVFAIIPNRARGYVLNSAGQLQNCSLADTSYKIPGGGMISTAEDIVRFGLAVRAGTLCRPASVAAMFTPQKLRDGKPTGYGLGWSIAQVDGRRVVRHTGGQQGTSTILAMDPREGLAVAIMTNLEKAQLVELSYKILKSLSGGKTGRDQRTGLVPALARP